MAEKWLNRATRWNTNADMISDIAMHPTAFPFFDGSVWDCTYGPQGGFWKKWCPEHLVRTDLVSEYSPDDAQGVDFTSIPKHYRDEFDAIVFDPPYKMSGTPQLTEMHHRYGTTKYLKAEHIYDLIEMGIEQCALATKKFVLLKCQDQVCNGTMYWQTYDFAIHAAKNGLRMVEKFDRLYDPIPQPEKSRPKKDGSPGAKREQKHAQSNYSSLLVFSK